MVVPILPLTILVPAITAGHWINEVRFCRKWTGLLEREEKCPRMLWKLETSGAAGQFGGLTLGA